MKFAVFALFGFLVSTTAFSATLTEPFKIMFHDHSNLHQNLSLRITVSCDIYRGNSFRDMIEGEGHRIGNNEDCGTESRDLKIGNDGIVEVPRLLKLKSLKKDNHHVSANVVIINDDGTKTDLKNSYARIDINDKKLVKDLSFYSGPALTLKPSYLVYYKMWIKDSAGNMIIDATESREGKDRKPLRERYLLVNGNQGVNPEMLVTLYVSPGLNAPEDSKHSLHSNVNYLDFSNMLEEFIKENNL